MEFKGMRISIQAVRSFSKKTAEYPTRYRPVLDPRTSFKKDHRSFLNRHMKAWLGPKNLRGEYYKNKYYYPSQDHQPRYIVQDGITDGTQVNPDVRRTKSRNPLAPFPENPNCTTNVMISHEMKERIVKDIEGGLHSQQAAHKYGVKMERIDAIVKLHSITKKWTESKKISPDLERFADVMYKMFPLYQPPKNADNLTEIPEPSRTLHQRFLTISETEPFGPVDAAKVYGLEPAQTMLEHLQTFKEDGNDHIRMNKVVVGTENKGDRALFKFTQAKVGNVGHRYGAANRDRKKNRRVGYDVEGRMVYM